MARKGTKLLDELETDLERLLDGIHRNQHELGDLAAAQDDLTTMLRDLAELRQEQERYRVLSEQATACLQDKMAEGRALRSRLRLSVRGRYGWSSERLRDYGIAVKE
jgi:DNA repair exonuclease SbcCD ATPase subunit